MPPLIAVIDDDDSLRDALVEFLSAASLQADGYTSALDFLIDPRTEFYDCIVTDIQMPGLSGFDLKSSLAHAGDQTPLILITARNEPGLEDKAASLGAWCLLSKPFSPDLLLAHVTDALEKRPTRFRL